MNQTGPYLHQMHATASLVHNITNFVAMNVMANVLLAAGASPAMVHAREEAAEFTALSQALTVNIGTPDADWGAAMQDAAAMMNDLGRPWVFDPMTDGTHAFRVANGHPLMTRATVMGCSLNGVIAAFCVGQPVLEGTVAALASYGLAGENAAQTAVGPGSFMPAFLDALAAQTPEGLTAGARVNAA